MTADLRLNIGAETSAKMVYENLMKFTDDVLAAGLAGAGAGGLAGGLIGALVGPGIPEARAKLYETC